MKLEIYQFHKRKINCSMRWPEHDPRGFILIECVGLEPVFFLNPDNRPIYIGKNQNPKTWVFCCTVYTARKTHNIRGFWHEKRMREKTRISYWCFGKWCACATSLYLWPYTCSAHYVAGRGRVIPLKVTWPKTRIIPARLERAFTLAKNQWNFGGVSKTHAAEVGFSIRVFWSV